MTLTPAASLSLYFIFFIGYAFAFGGQESTTNTTFIGTKDFASVGSSASFWFFQYTFSATSVTIVAGTLAERCQMAAYLCYSIFLAGFIYPVVAHSVWSNNGFLSITNIDPLLNVSSILPSIVAFHSQLLVRHWILFSDADSHILYSQYLFLSSEFLNQTIYRLVPWTLPDLESCSEFTHIYFLSAALLLIILTNSDSLFILLLLLASALLLTSKTIV